MTLEKYISDSFLNALTTPMTQTMIDNDKYLSCNCKSEFIFHLNLIFKFSGTCKVFCVGGVDSLRPTTELYALCLSLSLPA